MVFTDFTLCRKCCQFYIALDEVFLLDPLSRVAYMEKFNVNGRRELKRQSMVILADEKVQWIKTMLQDEESHLRSHSRETEQGIAAHSKALQVIIAAVRTSQQNDTRADMYTVPTFTQEHIHCHIVRYNLLMPHSDSARYRPSSHVPPARSNPLRFVKSAR